MAEDKKIKISDPNVIVPLMLEHGDTLIIGIRDTLTHSAVEQMRAELDKHLPGIKVMVIQCESLVVKRK